MTAAVLALGAMTGTSQAVPTFTLGNNPQAQEENILFQTTQTGSTVFGVTNTTNVSVAFSSTTDILHVVANGQANLTAADGFLNNISIALDPLGDFADMILDPQGAACGTLANPTPCNGNNSTNAVVTVVASDGTFQFALTIGNGNNFFTVVAAAGEELQRVTIDSDTAITDLGFENLKQPRISGVDAGGGGGGGGGTPVPEPGAIMVFGTALLGLGLLRRKARA